MISFTQVRICRHSVSSASPNPEEKTRIFFTNGIQSQTHISVYAHSITPFSGLKEGFFFYPHAPAPQASVWSGITCHQQGRVDGSVKHTQFHSTRAHTEFTVHTHTQNQIHSHITDSKNRRKLYIRRALPTRLVFRAGGAARDCASPPRCAPCVCKGVCPAAAPRRATSPG